MEADALGWGEHCACEGCNQIDFLPFRCDACSKTFCLDHRTYASHKCTAAGSRVTEVIVCPICAKGIRLASASQDPNIAWEQHVGDGCDPSNYAKVHRKPRCPVPGCKEKLTTINLYLCKHCSQRVCLRHRDKDDHGCDSARAANQAAASSAAQQRGLLQRLQDAVGGKPGMASTSSPTPILSGSALSARRESERRQAAQAQYADPTNSVKGTADRRRQMLAGGSQPTGSLSALQSSQAGGAAPSIINPLLSSLFPTASRPAQQQQSNANPLVPPHRPEECPQCGARFASVEQLIQHVEEWHPAGGATSGHAHHGLQASSQGFVGEQARRSTTTTSGAGQQEVYRCPHCSMEFADAVQLVGHAERCAQRPTATAAASGSNGGRQECVLQ